MASSENGEIFLADSQGWKEEAEAVIKDVKDHVQSIAIAQNIQSTDSRIYLNVTTVEGKKVTVELSSRGFIVVSETAHDTIEIETNVEEDDHLTYFETPYSLLDSISPGYRQAFGNNLASQLRKISQEQQ